MGSKPSKALREQANLLVTAAPKLKNIIERSMNESETITQMHTILATICCNIYRGNVNYYGFSAKWGRVDWLHQYPDVATGTEILNKLGAYLVEYVIGYRVRPEFIKRVMHLKTEYKGSFEEYDVLTRFQTESKKLGDAYPIHREFFDSLTLPPYENVNVRYYGRLNICTQMMQYRDDPNALATFLESVDGEWYMDYIDKMTNIPTWHPRMVDVSIILSDVPVEYEYLFKAVQKCLDDERIAVSNKKAAMRKSLALARIEHATLVKTALNHNSTALSPSAPGGPSMDIPSSVVATAKSPETTAEA